jgi:hypothetical protein
MFKQITCDTFYKFTEKFTPIFYQKLKQFILVPVRSGKMYTCEKYSFEKITNVIKDKLIVRF